MGTDGGVEQVVYSYCSKLNKDKFIVDFIIDEDSSFIPREKLEKAGINVIIVPPYQKVFEYQKALTKIFKDNKYDIVHSHENALSVFPLRAAKKAGIKVRIAHSHSTSNKKEWKRNILKNILRPFSKVYATDYMCCSELAGRYLFGNKTYNEGKVYLLNNAIDLEKFKYNEDARKEIRSELGVKPDTLVIGHIGRFVAQKNHEFLIDIFNEVHKQKENSILVLVGQGPLQESIKEKVKRLGLEENVKFLGQRTDANKLYQGFDVFCLPSLYEGLGMVLIEAQISGLKCVASSEVPNSADVTGNVTFLDLQQDAGKWSNEILKIPKKNIRKNFDETIRQKGYDIKIEVKKLESIYAEMLKNHTKIAIVSSGFLPVPSTQGGAVEGLVESLLHENEIYKEKIFDVYSNYDPDAYNTSLLYKYSNFIFIRPDYILKMMDKIMYFIAKKMLKKENSHSYKFIFQRLGYLRNVSKKIAKENYDKIILENHCTQYLIFKWHNNNERYRNKIFYHCHNEINNTYSCEKYMKNTNMYICISEYIKKNLIKRYDFINESNTVILKNCIDVDRFFYNIDKEEIRKELGIDKDKKLIVYTGRLVEEKGILNLVESLDFLDGIDYQLLIAGGVVSKINFETTFTKKLKEKCERYKKNILFLGYVDNNKINEIYQIADVVVLPSIWEEPAGLTMLEASASGAALVTTKVGGIPEYISDDSAIFLKNDENLSKNIAVAIKNILNNQSLKNELGKNGRNNSKRYNLDEYYKQFIRIIKKENNEKYE